MKPLARYTEEYFSKFSEKPVEIVPFDPETRKVAENYIAKLKKRLEKWNLEPALIGATAFGIAGKGDIEVALYLNDENWDEVIKTLLKDFGEIGNLEDEIARFNDFFRDREIEVILSRGYTAKVNKALHEFMLNNDQALKEYENLKRKYAYSKREYVRQRNEFFKKIILELPDN